MIGFIVGRIVFLITFVELLGNLNIIRHYGSISLFEKVFNPNQELQMEDVKRFLRNLRNVCDRLVDRSNKMCE